MSEEIIKKCIDMKEYQKQYKLAHREKHRNTMKTYMTSIETNPIIECELCLKKYRKFYHTRHITKKCHIKAQEKKELNI